MTQEYKKNTPLSPETYPNYDEHFDRISHHLMTAPLSPTPGGERFRMSIKKFLSEQNYHIYLQGYDHFSNLGDQALWISLERLMSWAGVDESAPLLSQPYSVSSIPRGDGPVPLVIFPGGGSLGTRYGSSRRRIELLEKSPHARFVQLPVSTTFSHKIEVSLKRVSAQYSEPGRGLIYCRDNLSKHEAEEKLALQPNLAPDLSDLLPDFTDFHVGGFGTLHLFRRDGEAKPSRSGDIEDGVDWQDAPPTHVRPGNRRFTLNHLLSNHRTPEYIRNSKYSSIRRRAAARTEAIQETARALTFLSYHDLVITDRLHGVLLSLKLGIPVIAVDNDHGKISRYADTWLAKSDNLQICSSHAQAISESRLLDGKNAAR